MLSTIYGLFPSLQNITKRNLIRYNKTKPRSLSELLSAPRWNELWSNYSQVDDDSHLQLYQSLLARLFSAAAEAPKFYRNTMAPKLRSM